MSMKSTIDWNEIVPRLPKKIRDDLYLQAVVMLSEERPADKEANGHLAPRSGYRRWREAGDGAPLWNRQRRYRINKIVGDKAFTRPETVIFKIWQDLSKLNRVEIGHGELAALAKAYNRDNAAALACALWERRAIDVVNG